jgi:hypothetical protein
MKVSHHRHLRVYKAPTFFVVGTAISVISCVLLVLVACGGGGGGTNARAPCEGQYLGQGICIGPSINALGGTVSGLTGSGLALVTSGNITESTVQISANGSFAFPVKFGEGETYQVVVSSPPTNPAQTCLVNNGFGFFGRGPDGIFVGIVGHPADVSDISVTCSTGVANASINGTYTVVRYDYAADSGSSCVSNFDGSGNFTGSCTGNGALSNATIAGTYSVATDSSLIINSNQDFGDSTIGGLSSDGATWVTSRVVEGFTPEIAVGIKHGSTTYSVANLTGNYTAVYYRSTDNTYINEESGLWKVTFDGNGKFAGTETVNHDGTISSISLSGTYTLAADGTLSITPVGGAPITGSLSADNNVWVAGQAGGPGISVGIKQASTTLSIVDLNGVYSVVHYDYGADRPTLGLWSVNFDGASNYSGTDIKNDFVSTSTMPISGTYTVSADGTLSVSAADRSETVGAQSADGRIWATSQTNSSELPSILVGVLRKSN